MRIVGDRTESGHSLQDQAAMARTAALVRRTSALVPRGVYRFDSFDEADRWLTETIQRTHERLSRMTSSGSAGR